jgi:hypothetical protein
VLQADPAGAAAASAAASDAAASSAAASEPTSAGSAAGPHPPARHRKPKQPFVLPPRVPRTYVHFNDLRSQAQRSLRRALQKYSARFGAECFLTIFDAGALPGQEDSNEGDVLPSESNNGQSAEVASSSAAAGDSSSSTVAALPAAIEAKRKRRRRKHPLFWTCVSGSGPLHKWWVGDAFTAGAETVLESLADSYALHGASLNAAPTDHAAAAAAAFGAGAAIDADGAGAASVQVAENISGATLPDHAHSLSPLMCGAVAVPVRVLRRRQQRCWVRCRTRTET